MLSPLKKQLFGNSAISPASLPTIFDLRLTRFRYARPSHTSMYPMRPVALRPHLTMGLPLSVIVFLCCYSKLLPLYKGYHPLLLPSRGSILARFPMESTNILYIVSYLIIITYGETLSLHSRSCTG